MMSESALHDLARKAGLQIVWTDVSGDQKVVSDESLRAVLAAIGLPAETGSQVHDATEMLSEEANIKIPRLLTSDLGQSTACQHFRGRFKIRFEGGGHLEGDLSESPVLPAVHKPGYHRLEVAGQEIGFAVSPLSSLTIGELAGDRKLWGLAVQLYALRRRGDSGIGDFAALTEFVRGAAAHGADAVAISPVHAQFTADLERFGPYAPSNRAALNVLHIAEPSSYKTDSDLVNWPLAGAAKMVALRQAFANFNEESALQSFRRSAGIGVERHAVFEAIHATLKQTGVTPPDWRNWPVELQDPESAAVLAFKTAYQDETRFQTYLQYRADSELSAVQSAALASGMKIGLIADLAVGTDPGGSHSWGRQGEILAGLEVGAPPDAINREGQSWGITAFSPRGLRESGYSGFIEMLRHALRHAGGVRIDHIMGLARLWIIPQGRRSAEGAYLQMPVRDLVRLVRLESYRHRAIILGEDLGTLPEGFQSALDEAGIAGLRVMWFEKDGAKFRQPNTWSQSAVAVTSTHDLPTIAGWWRGQDIFWREKLGMAGDGMDVRDGERAELWSAMVEADAAVMPMPDHEAGGLVADAACTFLGKTASSLAILPIEDALALPEQPNLPGTTDEHPNWRRRLPYGASEIFDQPDVARRLANLNDARSL